MWRLRMSGWACYLGDGARKCLENSIVADDYLVAAARMVASVDVLSIKITFGRTTSLPIGLKIPIERADRVEEVFEKSDFLTFHVPFNDATGHLVCKKRMALMKPDCRIVKTSRGGVIDESALVEALQQGTLAGAALDVFEQEPLHENHPLCHAPNILLTPHISSSTRESLDQMAIDAAHGVLDVLAGREPK